MEQFEEAATSDFTFKDAQTEWVCTVSRKLEGGLSNNITG